MSNTHPSTSEQSRFKGCLSTFAILALLGWIVEKSGFTLDNCKVCGSYTYKEFAENAFNDKDIADMIGSNRVEEYKQKLKNEAAAMHVLKFTDPETLEDGTVRGAATVYIQSRFSNDLLTYKGKFIYKMNDTTYNGMIRFEYQKNTATNQWEQIAFRNDQNVVFYKVKDKNLILSSGNTKGLLGICCYENAVFVPD